MTEKLYKVAKPRSALWFSPTPFWRSADWESSSTRPRDGYIEEKILFAGNFEEVSIHLFPRVWTVRVRAVDLGPVDATALEPSCIHGKNAWIFCPADRQAEVNSFCPTIFTFSRTGFTRVRRGEYISRAPRQAISCETMAIADAMQRWNIQCVFVSDLASIIERVRSAGVYFEEQT